MPQPIELYFWPTPNGRKVTIALEEMGLPYELKWVNIGAGEQFTPQFLAISPNNRMPAIVDPEGPDGKPISIFESGAILQYLGRKTGQFYGKDDRQRIAIDEWLFWQMANLGPNAGQANHFRYYAPTLIKDQREVAYGAHRYTCEVERLLGVLDIRLKGREWICDDYSIADMASYNWVLSGARYLALADFADLKAWVERMKARPAVQKSDAFKPPTDGAGLAGSDKEAEKARQILFGQRARRSA
ncbi:MAG: Glutathione S-transferase domain protein [Caulobacteraceae bacterium]|nr:Glutathione S-transferase domain protein [Caulobacteraceae bacterium]